MKKNKFLGVLFLGLFVFINVLITSSKIQAQEPQPYKLSVGNPYGCPEGSTHRAGCFQDGSECSYIAVECYP